MATRDVADTGRFPLAAVWLGALLCLAGVVFTEIGAFLLRIEGSSHAYGPGVYTAFRLKFWDSDELMGAAGPGGVWDTNPQASPFVSWHLTLDFLFALLVGLALLRALIAVTEVRPRDRRKLPRISAVVVLPLTYVALDLAETGYTFDAMGCGLRGQGCDFQISARQAVLIHLLSDLKWIALVGSLALIAGFYFWSGSEGTVSWQRRQERHARLRAQRQLVAGPPVGAVVVVALLVVLLALPGGSALDQMPDVIRAQIDQVQDHDYQHAAASVVSLLLFLATLLVIVHPPVEPMFRYDPPSREVAGSRWQRIRTRHALNRRDAVVVGGGVLLSVALVLMHRIVEGAWDLPVGLAPGIVVLAVFLLAVSTTGFRKYVDDRRLQGQPGPLPDIDRDREALRAAARSARIRAALLPGVVVLGAGIALVRAALPPVMKPGTAQPGEVVAMYVGLTLAAVCSVLLAALLDWLYRTAQLGRAARLAAGLLLGVVVLVGAARLAVAPERAAAWGAVAVVVVSLSAWLVVVAVFSLVSRHVVWQRTVDLKLGPRTPWLGLTIVVWLVAGVLDSTGGYHDARTVDVTVGPAGTSGDRTLDEAFEVWAGQFGQPGTEQCDDVIVDSSGYRPSTASNNTRKVPLVLVAAPGGGGKAAYWTALGMDQTFAERGFCPQSLFAASGVSGGSVGLTAALATPPALDEVEDDPDAALPEDDPDGDEAVERAGDVDSPEDAEDVVRRMTGEGPLAETITALLLRDIPQPLTTLHRQWRDRAAVLEDAWADTAPSEVFSEGNTKTIDDLGRGWWSAASGPVLLLNASSVNDGCRVLIANVRGISSGGRGCLSAPITAIDVAPSGAVSGSLDVLDQLLPGRAEGGSESDEEVQEEYCAAGGNSPQPSAQTLRATTSALLSARFPYVTPAGAMRRCLDVDERNLNEESALVVRAPRRSTPGSPAGLAGQSRVNPESSDEQQRLLSDTAYVVDGGYLENTGILSLLQVWEQVETRVVACNSAASADAAASVAGGVAAAPEPDGCPQDARGHLWVEPWFVMLENHYRSRVVPALSTDRPAEVLVPLATVSRKGATLGTTPLEQAMAIAVSRSYRSSPIPRSTIVSSCNRFVRLAPLKSPVVEAPLGWVLADDTRSAMRSAMLASWEHNLTVVGGTAHSSLQQRCTSYLDRVRVSGPVITADDHRP